MSSSTPSTSRYDQLLERACRFVEDQNGAAHEDLLIRHVFGSNGTPDLWRPLIRQVLAASEHLELRGDGCWTLAQANGHTDGAGALLSGTFTVIDVETTGLRPYQHRIIEFGAVRYRDGVPDDAMSILINPERRIPAYIRKLTGIDDGMMADAPLFADVAGQMLEFLGEGPIVGYNLGFDVSFLNAELKRLGRDPLLNEQIDILPVAGSVLRGTRSRGLESLARELGVQAGGAHRALADAETTGKVLVQLVPSLRDAGVRSIHELTGFRRPSSLPESRSEPVGRGRSILDERHVESAPSTPGVYVMYSARNRVIYVGKAKNLRQRIRSYYSQPLGYTRKMDGLLQSIDRIETTETGSELGALLLEAQLIARYQPQFNRQLRTSENYPYIRIDTTNPWPRVSLARESDDDGALYYGPYRSSRSAKATVEALNDIFPLRTCRRSFKTAKSYGSPCVALDLGQCAGPCTGMADADAYRGYIREVIAFLEGDVEPVMERLHAQLEETAERLDFERATKIRNRIDRVTDLSSAQRVLSSAVRAGYLAIVLQAPEPAEREIWLVFSGRPWARITVSPDDADAGVVERLDAAWSRARHNVTSVIKQHELDAVQIVMRWVRSHEGDPAILPLNVDSPDWRTVVNAARTLEVLP